MDISDAPVPYHARTTSRNTFKEIDKDEDWLITHDELMEFHVKKFGKKPLPPNFWYKMDKNEDGIITWEEFEGPKGTEGPTPKIIDNKMYDEL